LTGASHQVPASPSVVHQVDTIKHAYVATEDRAILRLCLVVVFVMVGEAKDAFVFSHALNKLVDDPADYFTILLDISDPYDPQDPFKKTTGE